jgi:hypothetical protein
MNGKPRAERGMLIATALRRIGTAKGCLTGRGLLVLSAALLLPLLMPHGIRRQRPVVHGRVPRRQVDRGLEGHCRALQGQTPRGRARCG